MPAAFEAAAAAARDLEALDTLFRAATRAHGFDAYAVGILHPADPPARMLLIDWPRAWLELYAASGFAAEDVAVAEALRTPQPFTWGEIRARQPDASRRVFAAAERFGWRDGFVVPVHGPGADRGIVSLASSASGLDSAARPRLERIAHAAYQHARRLAAWAPAGEAPRLTPRERQALVLVAEGRDDAEIAQRLGVTRATAHAHVERAKRRLGAATRAHAVALALVRRLL